MTPLNCSALFSALPPETTRGAEERSGREEMVSSSERCLVAPINVGNEIRIAYQLLDARSR